MRLQRFLSNVGFCSKRQAEKYIRAGKILVNGKTAVIGDEVSGNEDIVIDGQPLLIKKSPQKKVLVFYKPKGVECSLTSYGDVKTLLDFDFGADRVFPIGRLDRDSHGLLLLTNDGALGNSLARPSLEQEEEYVVTVKGEITSGILVKLAQGISLEKKKTVPCRVEQIETNTLRFILHDGRNRQIRKMSEAAGLQVDDLMRVRVGRIALQELKEGEWRVLNDAEFQALQKGKGN
jgi:23S rRNA pseudouridine2605 synthase